MKTAKMKIAAVLTAALCVYPAAFAGGDGSRCIWKGDAHYKDAADRQSAQTIVPYEATDEFVGPPRPENFVAQLPE